MLSMWLVARGSSVLSSLLAATEKNLLGRDIFECRFP